jgi:hypothetical protein
MAEQSAIGNDEPRNRERRLNHRYVNISSMRSPTKMTIAAHPNTFLVPFKALSVFRWALVAGALAVSAVPDVAAAQAARPGAFDGTWNVTFAPKAGNCHASNTLPFSVYGTRVSSAGGGKVTGGITRKGNVTVRITVGASYADGSGRLTGNSGAGRWSGLITGDRCSGIWQAIRS